MRRHLFNLFFLILSISATASPITSKEALQIATRYLQIAIGEKSASSLYQKQVYYGTGGTPVLFVYNIDNRGFILVCADDKVEPILGYSLNGIFDTTQIPPNFSQWISDYCADIDAIANGKRELRSSDATRATAEWAALRNNDSSFYSTKPGNVGPLLTSTWEQGSGYNDLCPSFSDGPGGHSYVGCVATAMAQIIRYHGYPSTGFGSSSYVHSSYGRLTAHHDSVIYDFAQMPDHLGYYSSSAQRQAVSLLCYHCGVSVSMNYQNASHTTGSGAQTSDAVDALRHFGFFHCKFSQKNDMTDDEWKTLLRNELDNGRPILYSGRESTESGHAFVCDGYNTSTNKFHFNWGWGGWHDGFFTLTDMYGFTGGQQGVYNIYPSGLAANLDTTYISADGTGDGSSWEHATSLLNDAIQARSYYKSGQVWVKEGTYYGDEESSNVISLVNGIRLYGGFGGDETGISQRDPEAHPTILDGQGQRAIAHTPSITKVTHFKGFVLQNGMSQSISTITIDDNLQATDLVIRNCQASGTGDIILLSGGLLQDCLIESCIVSPDSGAILNINDGTGRNLTLRNNTAQQSLFMSGGILQNSLITHNQGDGALISGDQAKLQCCDITYNEGIGLIPYQAKDIRNCLFYRNAIDSDTNQFNAVTYCAFSNSPFIGTGNIYLRENDIVFWMDMMPRGPHSADDFNDYSWHLKSGSPCIDAGDSITFGIPTTDYDGHKRVVGDRIDIGCCEHRSVDVEPVDCPAFTIWPNPTQTQLFVNGPEDASYTLYNIQGAMIRHWSHQPTLATLSLIGIQPGIYLLKSDNISTKIIVQ